MGLNLKPEDPAEFRLMQERELSHGRLAMLAAFGFMIQEAVTGTTWSSDDVIVENPPRRHARVGGLPRAGVLAPALLGGRRPGDPADPGAAGAAVVRDDARHRDRRGEPHPEGVGEPVREDGER